MLKIRATQPSPTTAADASVEPDSEPTVAAQPETTAEPKTGFSGILQAPGELTAKVVAALPKNNSAEAGDDDAAGAETEPPAKRGVVQVLQSTGQLTTNMVSVIPKPIEAATNLTSGTIERVGTTLKARQQQKEEKRRAEAEAQRAAQAAQQAEKEAQRQEERKQLRHQALYQWLSAAALTLTVIAKWLLDNS